MYELSQIVSAIKDTCSKTDWWKYVQDEVRTDLLYLIEHVDVLGTSFRDAFIANLKLEHAIRVINNRNVLFEEGTALFGDKFPEELFQSGIPIVKTILKLQEWVEPNEADVYACVIICQHINVLEAMEAIEDKTPFSASLISDFLSEAQLPEMEENEKKEPA